MMLKVLVKKQITEVFRNYFFDPKKNKMRSKASIALWIIFFVFVMVGILGGMFTMVAISFCAPFEAEGAGFMYFLMMLAISLLIGAFGSVFNTYTGVYLAKDNDLLLSMPIPAGTIVASRLINVYLLGTMYASTALIPMLAVYWIMTGVTLAKIVCGVVLCFDMTVLILIVACVLGYVVAKIASRLKNKSFLTVFIAIAFIVAYYTFYFHAGEIVQEILSRIPEYAAAIRNSAYPLYLLGRVGEGDWLSMLVLTLVTAALAALTWRLMAKTFFKLSSGGETVKVRYKEKAAKQRSPFGAFFMKELGRFTSSPNYMLNCGLGSLIIPAYGVAMIIKGREFAEIISGVFGADAVPVLICTSLCVLTCMNNSAAPSVSLEGKSIWIPKSMPLDTKYVLRAKAALQFALTAVPLLFTSVVLAVIADTGAVNRALIVILPICYSAFAALISTLLSVRMPILSWTNEIAVIKQSAAVGIAVFSCMAISLLFAGLYMFLLYPMGSTAYLAVWTAVLAGISAIILRWLDTKGVKLFMEM